MRRAYHGNRLSEQDGLYRREATAAEDHHLKQVLSRRQIVAAALVPALFRIGRSEAATAAIDPKLLVAIASPTRSAANVARDRYRHPAETLSFFGLRDDQSVLEIEPGAGYWTEILAPYLRAHGSYCAAIPAASAKNTEAAASFTRYADKLRADPAAYGKVIIYRFDTQAPIAPPNATDLALSFRNLHDWMADGTAAAKLAAIFAAVKQGGFLGIEDHRGLASQPQDPQAKSGYVREDFAVALIEKPGFSLIGSSPVGDNPRDTKNYPKGVWTLPPVLAMGQVDRAKYLAIGESDRWTLKFVKPV
jgi:predicted methyltransferase